MLPLEAEMYLASVLCLRVESTPNVERELDDFVRNKLLQWAFILRGSIYVKYWVPQNLTDFLQELHKDVMIFWGGGEQPQEFRVLPFSYDLV